MNMYAYSGFSRDFQDIEDFHQYKECGFDIVSLPMSVYYNGTGGIGKDKLIGILDKCWQVGLKCMFLDHEIYNIIECAVDTENQYHEQYEEYLAMSEEDLIQKLQVSMADYINHPAFYGLILDDEPAYKYFDQLAKVQRALRTIKPDIYIGCALNPYYPEGGGLSAEIFTGVSSNAKPTLEEYKQYLNAYMQKTGAERLIYDFYPFRQTEEYYNTHFVNLQVAAEITQKYNADLELMVQSIQGEGWRKPTEAELYFQNNAALAFGVKNIAYFTYWSGEKFASIMGVNGNKLLYDEVQNVNAYTQKMASVMLAFDYEKTYVPWWSGGCPDYLANITSENPSNISSVHVTQPTIVTQMKDKADESRKGYMVMNAQADINQTSSDTVTLSFTSAYSKVTYYEDGIEKTAELVEGTVSFELGRGEAVFVIPQ